MYTEVFLVAPTFYHRRDIWYSYERINIQRLVVAIETIGFVVSLSGKCFGFTKSHISVGVTGLKGGGGGCK